MAIPSCVAAALAGGLLCLIPSTTPQDPVKSHRDFTIEAGQHDIGDLLTQAAAFLHRNYLVNGTDLAALADRNVLVQSPLVLDALGCEEVTSQLAYTKGLVVAPLGSKHGTYEILSVNGPKRAELMAHATALTPEEVRQRAQVYEPVQVRLPLTNIDANVACNQLRPYFASRSQIQLTIGSVGDALLLTGLAPDVASAVELVAQSDTPTRQRTPELEQWRESVEARLKALEQGASSSRAPRAGQQGGGNAK